MHTNPEVLALLALGEQSAATSSDREHIAECPACSAEVDELAHLAGVGRSVDSQVRIETPSPEVWRRIATELNLGSTGSAALADAPADPQQRPVGRPVEPDRRSPTTPTPIDTAPSARRGRRLLTLAVAAVLALIVGIGVGIGYERLRQPGGTVVAQTPLEALPAWSGASGEATLERDSAGNQVLVVEISNPKNAAGSEEVWLIDPEVEGMVNIGSLVDNQGRFKLAPGLDVSRFPIVDVSDEPLDGVVQHSGNSIVRGTLDI